MKRKLVEYQDFAKMKENSLTNTVKELVEAEDHLARALNVDGLKLDSFDDSTVIYEQADGNFIRANYHVDNDKISFEDVEELVLDEETQRQEAKSVVKNMLEAILDDKELEATAYLEKYMQIASQEYKRKSSACNESVISEAYARLYGNEERSKGGKPVISYRSGSKDPKKVRAARKAHARHKSSYTQGVRKRQRNRHKEDARRAKYKSLHNRLRALNQGKAYAGKKKMNEWRTLSSNVFGYVDFVQNGHILSESVTDDNGNVTVTIPTTKVRNEGKVLKMHYDNMLKTDVKVLREAARRLIGDARFCHMVADVKRYNNISANAELEESIGNLVKDFPAVLYLTQEELAKVVGTALESVGMKNYDDNTCRFMAEGILRVAHDAYSDRVERIVKLANKTDLKESDDKYVDFQMVISDFFPTLDESAQREMKMFEDLYSAATEIRRIALESENDVVRNEAQEFLAELEEILNGDAMADFDLAVEVANWLEDLVEANLPGAGEWNVVKTPHKTTTGDHPQMNKNAKVDGVASQYPGDWGDPGPMIGQDSNAWNHGDEARNRSWGNKGGKDVWPGLTNPVVPSASEFTMKGEKGADKDDDGLGVWGSNDTFPEIRNPYIVTPPVIKQKVDVSNSVD